MEPVVARPQTLWLDLLGEERFTLAGIVASETGGESRRGSHAGLGGGGVSEEGWRRAELSAGDRPSDADGWVTLASNSLVIGTYAGRGDEGSGGMVLAVVVGGNETHS